MLNRLIYGKQGDRDRKANLQKLQTREMARQVALREEQRQRQQQEQERIEAERQRRREKNENKRLRAQLNAPPMTQEDWDRSNAAYAAQRNYRDQQLEERMDRRPDLAGGRKSKHRKSTKHHKSTKHRKSTRRTKSRKGTRRN